MSTEGMLAARKAGLELLQNLNARWGVNLENIINNEALSVTERHRLLVSRMLEHALMEIDEHDASLEHPPGALSSENKALIEKAIAGKDLEVEPNFVMTSHNFQIVRGYTGNAVNDYIISLSKRFEAMSKAKTPGQLALEIFGSSLLAVGTAMGSLMFKAWRAGAPLLTAIRTGITGIGMKTVITVVIIILAAILLYLFLENPKKILAIFINDTDDDLVVKDWRKGVDGQSGGNLWMEHGYMQNFPEDHASGDLASPLVQVRKRVNFGPDDPENSVYAGFFFADRNFGLLGAEGVMLFTSSTSNLSYALQFAVPYVKDNGTNMLLFKDVEPKVKDLYRDMYNNRRVRVDTNKEGVRMVSTVNDPRGGVVSLIASVSKV